MTFDEMLDKKIEAKVELILRKRFKQLLLESVDKETEKEKYKLPWIEDDLLRKFCENSKYAKMIYENHLFEKDLF